MIMAMTSYSADNQTAIYPHVLSATTNNGTNAVHIAAEFGHLDILRELKGWNVDPHATDIWNQNAAHLAAERGSFIVLRDLKDWGVDLDAEDADGETPMFNAIVVKQDLRTAQHLILLGAHIRPVDFPTSHIEIRQQLMAWADDHLTRHRTFVSTVLPAIHDDGSHSAVNQTNWLTWAPRRPPRAPGERGGVPRHSGRGGARRVGGGVGRVHQNGCARAPPCK